VGETVPIRHLGLSGEKTLNNLNSNNLNPNASKALLTQTTIWQELIFKTFATLSFAFSLFLSKKSACFCIQRENYAVEYIQKA
jgi:hypothetical protein